MPDFRNVTDWIAYELTVTAAESPLTFDWRGAEDLRGCQWWIKYTGTATVGVTADVSPCDSKSVRTKPPADNFVNVVVEAGAAGAGHFVAAPTEMDSSHGQYRAIVTTDATIVLTLAVCRHGLG